jgi:hypothetical protein
MRFWVREVAGWLLVCLGLFLFYSCFALLMTDRPRIFEAGPLTFIGFVVFRGGIHLLKVAVAARVCLLAQPQTEAKRLPAARSPFVREAATGPGKRSPEARG